MMQSAVNLSPSPLSSSPAQPSDQIFISLQRPSIKLGETLYGEVLMDIHQACTGSTVLLTVECLEKVFHFDECIECEQVMNVKTELYRFGKRSTTMANAQSQQPSYQSSPFSDKTNPNSKNNDIFKIPFSIEFSEIFEVSSVFKVSDAHTVTVASTITCEVVNYPGTFSVSQDDTDRLPAIEPRVLCRSTPMDIEIQHNPRLLPSLGEQVVVSQTLPRMKKPSRLSKFLSCCGCFFGEKPAASTMKLTSSSLKYDEQTKNESIIIPPTHLSKFSVSVSSKTVQQGDQISFTISSDSTLKANSSSNSTNSEKSPEQPKFTWRLINKSTITLSEEPLHDAVQVLLENAVPQSVTENVKIPMQAQPTYDSPIFKNTFTLEIVPIGFAFTSNVAIRIPITVTPKKFRLMPRKSYIAVNDTSAENAFQANIRRLSQVGKTIAKIELKFSDAHGDDEDDHPTTHLRIHGEPSVSPSAKTSTSSKQSQSPSRKTSSP